VGEIALRIHRAAKELGIATVAVHSTADADAMHVRLADESVCIGTAASKDSYLNMPAVLSAAASHGGGCHSPWLLAFWRKMPRFAEMVEESRHLIYRGPKAEHILVDGR
jgi:acetyl-CoA carboxylase biotin carboxylase subunit